jgi:EAL domain-containing protein (putative c-di-GMP-specific phosphodiesterase class I)
VVDDVQRALDAAGLPPDALVVEVTETALADDEPAIIASLDALRALGVRVALDDFGSGYSSVGLLARLPVDILKIDRAFTQGIGTAEGASLVTLMVGVGRTLGLDLVAEGVEDAALAARMAGLGCDHQQGWYHGRPVAAGAIEALLGIPPAQPARRTAAPRTSDGPRDDRTAAPRTGG